MPRPLLLPLLLFALTTTTTARSGEAPAVHAVTPAADDVITDGPAAKPAAPDEVVDARDTGQLEPAVRIAVADLDLSGVEPKVGRIFTESLLAEIRKLRRVSVISMEEVRAMLDLEAQKQMVGCDAEESCLAEIAGAVGADILIVGGLATLNDQSILGLKRIDQRSASVEAQVSRRLAAADGEEYLAVVGPVVEELFADRALRDGVTRGVDPQMALRINPPPLPRWAFWSSTAVTGTSAVATALAGAFWGLNQASYREAADRSVERRVSGAQLKGQERLVVGSEIAMWSFAGSTLALALVTGLMTPFVDWQGFGDEPDEL